MITVGAVLLAVILIGGMAGSAQAQMCAMDGQTSASSGQSSMMGGGKMGQGMCPMCMMQTMATRPEGTSQPMGMMDMPGMPGMPGDGQMDAKTRAHLLQMRGEMLKAMGDVMVKYGQTLAQPQ
jgi:hypothetical protein